ncbi:RNA-binding protein [Nannocystis sp.]|uniref:RNA recognition motif domain-containing protein n=1 Tax=Nannocystis sp. TaxID=1962667 RepID=UPI0025D2D094|nr:RNA-binding protein [Nannocystis sp.]MBK7825179.1 hypothetical protein [Nannocystis sp.]
MSSTSRTLYVGGFGSALDAHELRALFSRHGTIDQLRLVERGDASVAYVTFERDTDADRARRQIDGLQLAGRTLRVAIAK